MFEDSLVESRVSHISESKRWTALASISLQFAIAGVVIALPLLHQESLPFPVDPPRLVLPLSPKPPVPIVRVEQNSRASTSVAPPPVLTRSIIRSLLSGGTVTANQAPSIEPIGTAMGTEGGVPNAIFAGDGTTGPHVSEVRSEKTNGLLQISSGVSQGMLIAAIKPLYPAIARAAHVDGTVVVEAVISRIGNIESQHVVSGPAMLQNAALEAIRAARYQPYRLNGEPTEVQTTITVHFRLGAND
jgi:protein TonB